MARRAGERSATRQILESRPPDLLERLEAVDPAAAEDLRRYLRFWGLRPLGPEAGSPSLVDHPQMLADLLAEQLDAPAPADFAEVRRAAAAEARARLSGSDRRRVALGVAPHQLRLAVDAGP